MSADNGIYIVRFKDGKFYYRVIHGQAIENLFYFEDGSELQKAEIVRYCHNSKDFDSEELAWEKAGEMAGKIMRSAFPVIEYGISQIWLDIPYPNIHPEQAERMLQEYWDNKLSKK